jgi:HEAT repeat protein
MCSFVVQTHFDLLEIVRSDLKQLGFPQEAYEALDNYKAQCKHEDPKTFNAAAKYLGATKQALQCKLEAYSYMMLQQESNAQEKAAELLLNPDDAMALGHGIVHVWKNGLEFRYAPELEAVSASLNLPDLSLDLKGMGLEGSSNIYIDNFEIVL